MFDDVVARLRLLSTLSVLSSAMLMPAFAREPLEIGDKAPGFQGIATDGAIVSMDETAKDAQAMVICFTCNQCPFASAYEQRFIDFADKYARQNVRFVAINVNVNEDLEMMKQRAKSSGFNFPYVYDESQKSAASYGARATPHLFVVNAEGRIAYTGAFDDGLDHPSVNYVERAVDAVLAGEEPAVRRTKLVGCVIKWRKR